MKYALFLLPALLLTACIETQPMPRNAAVGRRIERMDGGAGDVPSVNHPNLDPSRGGYYNRGDYDYDYNRGGNYYGNGYNRPYDGYGRNGNRRNW